MSMASGPGLGALTIGLLVAASVSAASMDMEEATTWAAVETVEVLSHSPHAAINLYDQGSIDALGLRAVGGDVRCPSMEIWMADGRRIYIDNRTYEEGDISALEFDGVNRRVLRVEFSCHPTMGVTRLGMQFLVR